MFHAQSQLAESILDDVLALVRERLPPERV